MAIVTRQVNGATVYYDDLYNARWLDAVGEKVRKFELGIGVPTDDTTGDPTAFTWTPTEAEDDPAQRPALFSFRRTGEQVVLDVVGP